MPPARCVPPRRSRRTGSATRADPLTPAHVLSQRGRGPLGPRWRPSGPPRRGWNPGPGRVPGEGDGLLGVAVPLVEPHRPVEPDRVVEARPHDPSGGEGHGVGAEGHVEEEEVAGVGQQRGVQRGSSPTGRGRRIQCDRGPVAWRPPRNTGGSPIRISTGGGRSIQLLACGRDASGAFADPVLQLGQVVGPGPGATGSPTPVRSGGVERRDHRQQRSPALFELDVVGSPWTGRRARGRPRDRRGRSRARRGEVGVERARRRVADRRVGRGECLRDERPAEGCGERTWGVLRRGTGRLR